MGDGTCLPADEAEGGDFVALEERVLIVEQKMNRESHVHLELQGGGQGINGRRILAARASFYRVGQLKTQGVATATSAASRKKAPPHAQ